MARSPRPSRAALGLAAGLLAAADAAPAGAAEDAAVQEVRRAFAACEATRKADPDGWIGWRRSFFNGYGDAFAWWDTRGIERPPVVEIATDIDGIARQVDTSCFRADGSLAFVLTVMTAPRAGPDGALAETAPTLRREGRIYLDRQGRIVKVLGWIADAGGRRVARLGDPAFGLARGCRNVVLHRRVDTVEAHYVSVMGDIDGNRPAYEPEAYDWCAAAKAE